MLHCSITRGWIESRFAETGKKSYFWPVTMGYIPKQNREKTCIASCLFIHYSLYGFYDGSLKSEEHAGTLKILHSRTRPYLDKIIVFSQLVCCFEYLRIILEYAHLSSSHESDEKFESMLGKIYLQKIPRLVD